MEFLNQINWETHDGVNRGMINDFVRNQFYDRIISRYVPGQDCIDIGFGTGLLSMIALKRGARHIQAFESDYTRYQLGCAIIDELKLKDRIELVNERFDRSFNQRTITFTETVSGDIWGEGLWNTLPSDSEQYFLPGTYFVEMWAVSVSQSFAQGLYNANKKIECFNPGVDVDQNFVNLINRYQNITVPESDTLPNGIVRFNRQVDTVWGWIPYMRAVQAGTVVAKYQTSTYIPEITHFEMDIDTSAWTNQHVLIVPRAGMKQDNDVLYLDTGHWGPTEDPVLLVRPEQNLLVTHNVKNGRIRYSLKD